MHLSPRSIALAAVVAAVLSPSVAAACMWDADTVRMERSRFPGTLELVTGKFLRHSPEFYEWRVADRRKRLQADPTNVALLDDLAVVLDKLGRHAEAIGTAERTEALRPGRYETSANLATFLFHAGRPNASLLVVGRALTINPDAHFGREKYQRALTEYVLKRRNGGPLTLPLADVKVNPVERPGDPPFHIAVTNTFADHLRTGRPESSGRADRTAAIKAVGGMLRFARHDSPVLLEALGSVLTDGPLDPDHDAKFLAARAYLKASYEVPDGPPRRAYRDMAHAALLMQTPNRNITGQVTREQVEADFQKELADARDWYAALHEREREWVRTSPDPEAEFNKLYDADPEVPGMDFPDPMPPGTQMVVAAVVTLLGLVNFVCGVVLLARLRSCRRTAGRPAGPPIIPA